MLLSNVHIFQRKTAIRATVALLALISSSVVSSFRLGSFRSVRSRQSSVYSSSSVGRAEWNDDDSFSDLRDVSKRKKLSGPFTENLDWMIGTIITKFALSTVSCYMIEFHNDVNEKWMMGFCNYRKGGEFPDGQWTNYIEKMIMTDKLQVEVLMTASKASLRSRNIPEGGNVMMQYFHDLEPRRIAHQIITVREDVGSEIIRDLGCIQLENEEAIRFACTWARDGKEVAEKSRRLTRICEYDDSTPRRDINYIGFNNMISALAVQLVREELLRNKDTAALDLIDELTIKIGENDDSSTMKDRLHQANFGLRSFMERLYYRGVTDGIKKSGSKTLNAMKVAESFLEARLAIAKEASKMISSQSVRNRHYYRMIKDYGGFQKLDSAGAAPKVRLVEIDLKAREDAKNKERVDEKSAGIEIPATPIVETVTSDDNVSVSGVGSPESVVSPESSGPMMM